ncbi:creatinase [Sinorhizobium sp. NFACC03]|nr:creatinase [Sinorhizobium sp. NFACC03]
MTPTPNSDLTASRRAAEEFSDFLYCSFGRRYAFVITLEKATSISAGIDAGQPWRRTFGDNITYTDWQRDNFFHALQTLLPKVSRIGIEFDQVNLDLELS